MTTIAELQKSDRKFLSNIESQKAYIVQIDSVQETCPVCGTPQNVYQAAGIDPEKATYDDAYPRTEKSKPVFKCVKCKIPLKYVVPFVAIPKPWFWAVDIERGKAEKYTLDFKDL